MTFPNATKLATQVAGVRQNVTPLAQVSDDLVPATQDDGYAVQDLVHAALTDSGFGTIVGHKIGCTTPVMQEYMQIDTPCSGGIFASTVAVGHHSFNAQDHQTIGVECEIAVRLGTDLVADENGAVTHDMAAQAVATMMAAIEIVEDRYTDYRALDTAVLIADDFFNAGCVLGEEFSDFDPHQLDTVTAAMHVNGVEVGAGRGSDVLGHPLTSLCWLAEQRSRRGQPLQAGEFVLLGSVVQTYWLTPGDEVKIINDPFGVVTFTLHA
jgi:2-oxo-3-hexenedioate decarboxylase/2-keto-4-pentenoate hydratase